MVKGGWKTKSFYNNDFVTLNNELTDFLNEEEINDFKILDKTDSFIYIIYNK